MVAAAVNACPELNGEYRIRLTHPPPYDRLPLEVELLHDQVPNDNLCETIRQRLADTLRLGLALTLLPSGTLERTEGKTRRLIKDYRQ